MPTHALSRILSPAAAAALIACGSAALAQDFDGHLSARQGQFASLGLSLGVLGGMARGRADYDPALAQLAADYVVAIASIPQSTALQWPEGSDNMALDTTRAEPAIWDNFEDFTNKWAMLGDAAAELQAVAGTGADALGPAVGALGQACRACHQSYRGPEN
ncbi:c-type cytochrome [Poseidonocella sedimentorum]|uniref:Cytochrome c556 n=1 Tax=Poseidonocella sedimentorum TaxID=871652 RepID=A0A1I6E937_9RHOB|nr:cytochrome c [Poseidonocella sedimentorum]SFR14226.1 Cytochrome c556 [Poseidonocella sedimentorum]